MQILVTVIVASLFSVWVYSLKQELGNLNKRLAREVRHRHATQSGVAPVVVRAPSRDGVQTWLLE